MANNNRIEVILTATTQGLTQGVDRASKSLRRFSGYAEETANATKMVQAQTKSLLGDMGKMVATVATYTVVFGAFASALNGIKSAFGAADTLKNIDQRLLLTAKNTNDYAAAQETVVAVARDSHQSLEDVATLYTRMALATANLNVSQRELAEVTKTVALATALSGSSSQEASAGLQQFAQAMASNRLGGEELRSVLENMPLLTKVFVDAAGGSIAKLREMSENGELTTKWMIEAIKASKDNIESQAAAMPLTLGRAMTDLRNETSKYIEQVDKSTGATDIFSKSIHLLSQNIDLVAKGGFLALSTAISVMVGRGLTAAISSTSAFIASLGVAATATATTGTAISSAAAYMSGSYAPAAATVATTTMSRLIPALVSLVNPITIVTTVLGIGAAAWAMWGRSADDELDKAKQRVAQLQRTNQMLKELSDPGIRLQSAAKNIESARAEVARLEAELARAVAEPSNTPFDNTIGMVVEQLDAAKKRLGIYEQEHAETQKNIVLSAQQRGAKEVATEMSVTDAIRKQDEERRKITASKLENDLAEIAAKRKAELLAIEQQFKGEDLLRVQKAVNARFDAAAEKARKDAAEEAGRKAEAAARKAEAEAKRRERELLKQARLQDKIDTEKIRAQGEKNLLELEREKLNAESGGTELERAQKLLDINRRIAAEQIRMQVDEAKRIKDDPSRTEADVIRAETDITRAKLAALRQEHSDLAAVATARMDEIEQAWLRGEVAADQYHGAVRAAGEAGILTAEQMREKLISSGDDMGAALSLGFQRARENMQTDAEVMIGIGQNLGDQLASGATSAWSEYINRTKSAKEAFIDFAKSTISWLGEIILKQMLLNAIGTGTTTDANGVVKAGTGLLGAIGLAGGGSVPGYSPSHTADNIPAWLTAREFVQPVRAVDHYGLAFMERVRRLQFPRHIAHALAGGTIPSIPHGSRLASGGIAATEAGQSSQASFRGGDTYLKVVNVQDKSMLHDLIRSAEGETLLINFLKKNGSVVQAIARG